MMKVKNYLSDERLEIAKKSHYKIFDHFIIESFPIYFAEAICSICSLKAFFLL